MALNLRIPVEPDLKPRITVIGAGGAGGNAVNNMIEKGLEGAEFIVANTDAQALANSKATRRIQLGSGVTKGLGAGARPEVGASAAEDSIEEITEHLRGANMCFIAAGMGGGTGTGAAPIIARVARDLGVLTVGVVTKPFNFEGRKRMRMAEQGIEELQQYVNTLIVIPNQNLFRVAKEGTTFMEAFAMADDVLYQGVKGVTDLVVKPGVVNLDFADVCTVMSVMGKAMMGTGEGEGATRAVDAARRAISNELLDEMSLQGARGLLVNVTGGPDLTALEVDEAVSLITREVDPDAEIIFGSSLDPNMQGRVSITVVATGIDVEQQVQAPPVSAYPPRGTSHTAQPTKPYRPAAPVGQPINRAPEPRPVSPPPFDPRAAAPQRQVPSMTAPQRMAQATPQAPSQRPTRQVPPPVIDDFEIDEASLAEPAPQPSFRAPQRSEASRPATAPNRRDQFLDNEGYDNLRSVTRDVREAKEDVYVDPVPPPQAQRRAPTTFANDLIRRMTGRGRTDDRADSEGEHAPESSPKPGKADLSVDRNELPSFLRKQAN